MPRLSKKVALVTGAARGLGEAMAGAFLREGAKVIVSDINEALGRATAERIGAAWLKLDVRDELAWLRGTARILDTHGRLDILVNNAGISGLEQGLVHDPEHAALTDWRAVLATNLDGVFLGCKHGLRAMRHSSLAGSIINIASRSGVVGIPTAAAYAASKAAVCNHTKTVALYCAEQQLPIRCKPILPAAILTPMWEPMLGTGAEREVNMATFVADTPLRRFGRPEEVAALAVMLASNECPYMTGAELHVDGGLRAGSVATPRPTYIRPNFSATNE